MSSNIQAAATPIKSRPHNIATFKDRDEWIRLFLAADGDTLSAGAKIVGTCISLHHNVETGQCDPPIRMLVPGTGMSESTVYRMLRELEASGWIRSNRTGGRYRNFYELRVPTLSDVTGFNPVNSDRVQETPTLSPLTPQPCHPRQGNPVTADTPNDKRIDKRKDKRRRDSPQLDLGDEDSGRRRQTLKTETKLVWTKDQWGNHIAELSDSRNYAVAEMQDGRFEVTYLDRLEDGDDTPRRRVLAKSLTSLDAAMAVAHRHADKLKAEAANLNSETETNANFQEFWKAYPKHKAKAEALKTYRTVISKGLATPEQLLNGAMRYAAERSNQDPQYTPHASTWLNKGRWDDEPDPTSAPYSAPAPGHSHHIDISAQIARQIQAKDQEAGNV